MTDLKQSAGGLELLLEEARTIAPDAPAERDWTAFDWALGQLMAEGWRRADVHDAVTDLVRQLDRGSPDEVAVADLLAEFDTAVTGFVQPKAIVRFPGEPADPLRLAAYVRGNAWRTSPR